MNLGERQELIFVIENKLGGVAYFNWNIINYRPKKELFFIKIILLDQLDSTHPRFNDVFNADEVIQFKYSIYENKYAVLKRLHKLFGTNRGAIVCNDGLEMECLHLFGSPKTVFQIIHDFYNIRLAVKLGAISDVFISHTKLFADVLKSSDPVGVKSFHQPHGVLITDLKEKVYTDKIKVVFTGRLVDSKGILDLFAIDEILKKNEVEVQWTIIGNGYLETALKLQWGNKKNIRFASPVTNQEVISIMSEHHVFVLPTRFEGSPVTVLEALSVGLVAIVSDLPGGIDEVITSEVGFKIDLGNNKKFAEAILLLNFNRDLLSRMSADARLHAVQRYDIRKTAESYFQLFRDFREFKRNGLSRGAISIGFRLDKKWLPNFLVLFLRKKLLRKEWISLW